MFIYITFYVLLLFGLKKDINIINPVVLSEQ